MENVEDLMMDDECDANLVDAATMEVGDTDALKNENPENGCEGKKPDEHTVAVFVGGLPASTTSDDVHTAFSAVGPVAYLNFGKDGAKCKGDSLVYFADRETAEKACEFVKEINGAPVGVHLARDPQLIADLPAKIAASPALPMPEPPTGSIARLLTILRNTEDKTASVQAAIYAAGKSSEKPEKRPPINPTTTVSNTNNSSVALPAPVTKNPTPAPKPAPVPKWDGDVEALLGTRYPRTLALIAEYAKLGQLKKNPVALLHEFGNRHGVEVQWADTPLPELRGSITEITLLKSGTSIVLAKGMVETRTKKEGRVLVAAEVLEQLLRRGGEDAANLQPGISKSKAAAAGRGRGAGRVGPPPGAAQPGRGPAGRGRVQPAVPLVGPQPRPPLKPSFMEPTPLPKSIPMAMPMMRDMGPGMLGPGIGNRAAMGPGRGGRGRGPVQPPAPQGRGIGVDGRGRGRNQGGRGGPMDNRRGKRNFQDAMEPQSNFNMGFNPDLSSMASLDWNPMSNNQWGTPIGSKFDPLPSFSAPSGFAPGGRGSNINRMSMDINAGLPNPAPAWNADIGAGAGGGFNSTGNFNSGMDFGGGGMGYSSGGFNTSGMGLPSLDAGLQPTNDSFGGNHFGNNRPLGGGFGMDDRQGGGVGAYGGGSSLGFPSGNAGHNNGPNNFGMGNPAPAANMSSAFNSSSGNIGYGSGPAPFQGGLSMGYTGEGMPFDSGKATGYGGNASAYGGNTTGSGVGAGNTPGFGVGGGNAPGGGPTGLSGYGGANTSGPSMGYTGMSNFGGVYGGTNPPSSSHERSSMSGYNVSAPQNTGAPGAPNPWEPSGGPNRRRGPNFY